MEGEKKPSPLFFVFTLMQMPKIMLNHYRRKGQALQPERLTIIAGKVNLFLYIPTGLPSGKAAERA